MERCYLTNARQRFRNGQTVFSSPSRFIKDIDSCYIQSSQGFSVTPQRPVIPQIPKITSTSSSGKLKKLSPSTSDTGKSRKEVRSEWKKNDRVEHKVFGAGTVLDVYRENDNDKIDIKFDNNGQKTLLLTYAKLTKI
jgi:DNA helicase-2/ATP-dependent DNA helicase PcrA